MVTCCAVVIKDKEQRLFFSYGISLSLILTTNFTSNTDTSTVSMDHGSI